MALSQGDRDRLKELHGVMRGQIAPSFTIDHALTLPTLPDFRELPGLEVAPPRVRLYFVRVREELRQRFLAEHELSAAEATAAEDEIVYRNSEA